MKGNNMKVIPVDETIKKYVYNSGNFSNEWETVELVLVPNVKKKPERNATYEEDGEYVAEVLSRFFCTMSLKAIRDALTDRVSR
jgi:hypothetical protein